MKKIEFKSIKTKLIVSMVALVLISCIILAAVSAINARSTMENEMLGTYNAVGLNSAGQMTLILQEGTDLVNMVATRPASIDLLSTEQKSGVNQEKRTTSNTGFKKSVDRTSDAFDNVMLVNLEGEVISSNKPENIGKSYKDSPLFVEGQKGNYISTPYFDDKKVPTLGYATNVADSENKTIGVVLLTTPMESVEKIVLDPSGLGSTGKGMIVDLNQAGLILSHVKGADDAFLNKKAKIDLIQEGKLNYWTNFMGENVLGSRYSVKEKPGWYLVYMEDQGDALKDVNAMIMMMIIITILIIIAGVAFAYYLARSIATPIIALSKASDDLALGDVNQTISYTSADELGTLADSFRRMIENFKGKTEVATALSVGNLDVTVPVASDRDSLGLAMTQMKDTITGMVNTVKRIAVAAEAGQLKERGDADQFKGEYKNIIAGLNNTLDSVINPVNEAMRLSDSYSTGDYTDRISEQLSVKGDFIPFKEALNQIGIAGSTAIGGVKSEIESLTAGMEETNASAEEVSSATSTVAQSSNNVSLLAERSGNGINQTLNAMEDLSQTVSAVATKAEQASAMAKQTVDLSEKGVHLAGKAEKGMEGIMQSVDETSSIITDITSQMEEIGKIVDVITGIAEQTGLLALNAAIEAARAGDAGMGFAVVADEVKSLALESQKSAENIATIIGNLQKKSELVSDSMKTSATEVKAGNEAVSETLNVFNQIVQAINVVHNNMTEVAGATEEQAAAVEEITASVHEVGGLVQKTAEEAVSSAAATEEVTASIDQITRAISEAAASVQKISNEMGKFTTS
ncbi:MAG TPA: methyl-accepting chemotaxis protein [Methanospirillum sp.]|uniref:methyl-accepting chemotaxis protein n=1 Tax=Methanospirillum sp. TaxID=45200 RepID=UPI002C897F1B|nr:methyl-accepting chemotaxis protein [Methanospirillum sp.]HWQ64366.1 methyl-accepting chemotaxis protein [Methanospirillum sp.]